MGLWGSIKHYAEKVPGVAVATHLYDQATGQGDYNAHSNFDKLDDDTQASRNARSQYQDAFAAPGNAAPTMQGSTLATGPQDQSRGLQQQAADSYQGVLNGTAPSVAQLQGQASSAQAAANQGAIAAGAHGAANRALAMRTAMNNTGALQAGQGADAALLRANEVNMARGGLANAATSMRTADQAIAGKQADLTQDASKTNASNQLTNDANNNSFRLGAGTLANNSSAQALGGDATKLQQTTNDKTAQQKNNAGTTDMLSTLFAGSDERAKTDISPAGESQMSALFKSLGSGSPISTQQPGTLPGSLVSAPAPESNSGGGMSLGKLTGMLGSDKGAKVDVESSPKEARVLFAQLNPKSFNYKPGALESAGLSTPDTESGKHLGVIAQDVEKAGPLGKGMVKDVNGLKAIDIPMATSALMAGMADFEHRLKQIEGKKGRK